MWICRADMGEELHAWRSTVFLHGQITPTCLFFSFYVFLSLWFLAFHPHVTVFVGSWNQSFFFVFFTTGFQGELFQDVWWQQSCVDNKNKENRSNLLLTVLNSVLWLGVSIETGDVGVLPSVGQTFWQWVLKFDSVFVTHFIGQKKT